MPISRRLILTATQRLAVQLDGLPLSHWVTKLLCQYDCKKKILSESQEHTIWQLIIAASVPHFSFSQQSQIASSAQQAWHLMTQWNIPITHVNFSHTHDTRLFKQWSQQFTKRCRQQNWLDVSRAIENLITDIYTQKINLPAEIIFVGFPELNPQQQRLIDALSSRGCQCEVTDSLAKTRLESRLHQKLALSDSDTEYAVMARWVCQYRKQNPTHHIACIVPQLTQNRVAIEDAFIKINPALSLNISATQTLNTFALIKNALSVIARSAATCPPQPASPSQWAEIFTALLNTAGWPDNRALDHRETQLCTHWQTALTAFASLDLILPAITYDDAFQRLQNVLNTVMFQPAEIPNAIQILDPIDAIGLAFDAVWLINMQDTFWPPAPRPNPFIPIMLQRELKMPYASAEQTLTFYRQLTKSLLQQTPHIISSYAVQDPDGNIMRPSPFIQSFSEIQLADLDVSDTNPEHSPAPLEWIIDEWAPPALPHEAAHSGSGLFKYQAACPFRAFAQYRLGADAPKINQAGLSHAERGTLMHQMLEMLWKKLSNHTELCKISETDLRSLIQKTIQQTLPTTLKKRFRALEIERLTPILLQWLMLEKKREFFTVKALEQKQTIQLGKYPVSLRIDRIDELSDGTHLVIDYKTGGSNYSENDWYGERPDEPQIPLYCVASPYPSGSAAFAQINSGKMGFKSNKDKTAANWQEQIRTWETVLKNLVQQFENGYAGVDPKDPSKTCNHCHLSMVCRIKEGDPDSVKK